MSRTRNKCEVNGLNGVSHSLCKCCEVKEREKERKRKKFTRLVPWAACLVFAR